jgi:hypothetical protein
MPKQQTQNDKAAAASANPQIPLVEGEDYYLEDAMMVFTARYLLRRGYCCDNGCRECPYEKESAEVLAKPRS